MRNKNRGRLEVEHLTDDSPRSEAATSGEEPGTDVTRRNFLKTGSLVLGGLTVGPTALGLAGCHRNGDSVSRTVVVEGGTDQPVAEVVADSGTDVGEATTHGPQPLPDPRAGHELRSDLLDHLHLADIEHRGTFIDFGTPSKNKYILGGWRSGWGNDGEEEGVNYTWGGASPSRLYFHLDEARPLQLRFRLKPRSNRRLTIYVNERSIERLELPNGWSEQVVNLDASQARAGENSLKIVHSSNSDRGRSFAIDYLRIIPSDELEEGEGLAETTLPRMATLIGAAEVGGEQRPLISLRAPSRLSYFLEIPERARLVFSAATIAGAGATALVRLTSARSNEAVEAHRSEVTPEWRNIAVDLDDLGGEVVRIDLEVSSADNTEERIVGFATPSIVTRPAPRPRSFDEPPRHVIVLLIDTLRADRLSIYGRTRVETPAMERFAPGCTIFDRCQAPANWTKPSCASLLTGLHPPTHRALTESNSLPRRHAMVSELFQEAGFHTAAFIANGYLATDFGFNRGWDIYRNYIRERLRTEAEHVFEDAQDWIERHRDERMFVYIQTIDPHVPYDPPESDLRRYDPAPYSGPVRNRSTGYLLEDVKGNRVQLSARDKARLVALYDGEVTYHDRCFGSFVERLGELGLLDSSLLVVTADHGEEFFEHESVGHGHSLYQELLHVPLLFRYPPLARGGERLGQVCSLVDVAPTILEAAGLQVPDEMEGRSLVADLLGAAPPMTSAGFSSQWDTGNDRELSWAARVGDWKLRMHGPGISYLYDLSADPGERRDVDGDHPLALRAARIALGQFLGAASRRDWTAPAAAPASRPPRRRAPRPQREAEEAEMTPELCEQLRALGYLDIDECE